METENEQTLEGVEESEENTQEFADTDSQEEETVTIPKSKFNAIRRKAVAYDANKEKPRQVTQPKTDDKWKERMEIKVDFGINDPDAIEFIMKNGGKKAMENPFIVKTVESMKEQKQAEQATIDEGSKSETEKRFSPREFAKLTASEQEKILSDL